MSFFFGWHLKGQSCQLQAVVGLTQSGRLHNSPTIGCGVKAEGLPGRVHSPACKVMDKPVARQLILFVNQERRLLFVAMFGDVQSLSKG